MPRYKSIYDDPAAPEIVYSPHLKGEDLPGDFRTSVSAMPQTMGELPLPGEDPAATLGRYTEAARRLNPRGWFDRALDVVLGEPSGYTQRMQQTGLGLMGRDIERQRLEEERRHQRQMEDIARADKLFAALAQVVSLKDVKLRPKYLDSVEKLFGKTIDPAIKAHFLYLAENSPETLAEIYRAMKAGNVGFSQLPFDDPVKGMQWFNEFERQKQRDLAARTVETGVPGAAGRVHGAAIRGGMGAEETKLAVQAVGGAPAGEKYTNDADRIAAAMFEGKPDYTGKKSLMYDDLKPEHKQAVINEIQRQAVEKSAKQGAEAAQVALERDLAKPASMVYANKVFLSKADGKPINTLKYTAGEIHQMAKENKIVQLDAELGRRYNDLQATERLLPLMKDIAHRALTAGEVPGLNVMNRLAQEVKILFGLDTPMVELKSMKGVRLLLARLMQGAAQQLSNLDVRITEHLGIDESDSIPLALRKLGILEKILDFQRKAVLETGEPGETPTELLQELRQASTPGGAALEYLQKKGGK